jgi:cell wall-associated NlpC family hydrolase
MSSLVFFSACSSKSAEVKQSSNINDLPLAQTYPVEEEYMEEQYAEPLQTPQQIRVTYAPPQPNYYYENRPFVNAQPPMRPQAMVQQNYHRNYQQNLASRVNSRNVLNNIERGAKKLLGIKYVWGATGPYTYDCSGFTQKVYRDAGISLPRVSRDQARVGQYISYNNLRRGDMVFFDTHKKRTGKVTHVGIYLGNGNFIHASSGAKKVVIFNFNEKEFYKKRFLWGRRVIQDNVHFASL